MSDHIELEFGIVGFAERASERKITKESSRRCSIVYLLSYRADGDGGNTCLFKHVCKRTDRTRA